LVPLYDKNPHTAPVDGYTLIGFQWDRVYPTVAPNEEDLLLTGRNFLMRADKVDFYNSNCRTGEECPFRQSRADCVVFKARPPKREKKYLYGCARFIS
jgi:hypothetical protein